MRGTRFEVKHSSGRSDVIVAKNVKHYEQCKTDLRTAQQIGAVASWKETNPKTKKVEYYANN